MQKVAQLILESNFLLWFFGDLHWLWWRWGYITFGSSWSRLKQWVSLNNRRDLSSVDAPPPQILLQLSELVLYYSSSSHAHWHEIKPYHGIRRPFSLKLPQKHCYENTASSWQLLNNESPFGGLGGFKGSHMSNTVKDWSKKGEKKATTSKPCQEN